MLNIIRGTKPEVPTQEEFMELGDMVFKNALYAELEEIFNLKRNNKHARTYSIKEESSTNG